jgi:hypothetical protein
MALCFLRKRFRYEVREHLPRQEEGERPDRRFHHIQSSDLWYVICVLGDGGIEDTFIVLSWYRRGSSVT